MEARVKMWVEEMGRPVSRAQEIGIRTILQVFGNQRMANDSMAIGKMRPLELDN